MVTNERLWRVCWRDYATRDGKPFMRRSKISRRINKCTDIVDALRSVGRVDAWLEPAPPAAPTPKDSQEEG